MPNKSLLLYEAPEYYVRIYRKSNPEHFSTIEKIRSEINKRWLESDKRVKVHVFGRYSEDPSKTQARCDAFLELVAIWIFEEKGYGKGYAIEGVIGGIYGRVYPKKNNIALKNNQLKKLEMLF